MPTEVTEETTTVNAIFIRSVLIYDPPVNPNDKTIAIHDDSEDEVDEVKKEVDSSSSNQTKSNPPPFKVYKPKIPYPQCLHKEKMEERYPKLIDIINEVRINIPLVDVLAGMPNYEKFLKDLVSKKRRPFLHTTDAIIRVKNKEFNLRVADDRITFLIDKAMQHSHSNDETCFNMDVIDEVIEEELNALLDDSKLFSTTLEKISESSLGHEFEEFMAIKIKEIPKQEKESYPLYSKMMKRSILFPSSRNTKKHLQKTSDIPGIIPSFCKHKINFEDDAKLVIQRQPTFQRCMIAIFQDMLETSMEVFMDDFLEKYHFMVTEGIMLGHKVFGAGLEVDKDKEQHTTVEVCSSLEDKEQDTEFGEKGHEVEVYSSLEVNEQDTEVEVCSSLEDKEQDTKLEVCSSLEDKEQDIKVEVCSSLEDNEQVTEVEVCSSLEDNEQDTEGLESVQYGVSKVLDTAYLEFLGVGTTIRRIEHVSFVVLVSAGTDMSCLP
nr:reverse transcriptase domain-containing protein [Tanacetum cinerariifolium]